MALIRDDYILYFMDKIVAQMKTLFINLGQIIHCMDKTVLYFVYMYILLIRNELECVHMFRKLNTFIDKRVICLDMRIH